MNREITKPMIDEETMNDMISGRKERRYGGFKFGNNLFRFFHEMNARDYKVTYMECWGEKVMTRAMEDYTNLDEVTYQAQNYEGCKVILTHRDSGLSGDADMGWASTGNRQTVLVDYTGDAWCDVVPIMDWSVPRDHPDVVKMVVDMIREDVLGDDA